MSLIPNENLRHRSDYPGDDCQQLSAEVVRLTTSCNELVEALEKIVNLAQTCIENITDDEQVVIDASSAILIKHKADMGEK